MDIRKKILAEMKRRKMKPADLSRRLGNKVKARTLYDFVNGKRRGEGYVYPPINSDALGHILDVLKLDIDAQTKPLSPTEEKEALAFLDSLDARIRVVEEKEQEIQQVRFAMWHWASAVYRRSRYWTEREYFAKLDDTQLQQVAHVAAFVRAVKEEWCDTRSRH